MSRFFALGLRSEQLIFSFIIYQDKRGRKERYEKISSERKRFKKENVNTQISCKPRVCTLNICFLVVNVRLSNSSSSLFCALLTNLSHSCSLRCSSHERLRHTTFPSRVLANHSLAANNHELSRYIRTSFVHLHKLTER